MNHVRLIPVLLFIILLAVPLPALPEFGGANSATRLMLTAAIVDDGTTQIDTYAALTPDKAQVGDHFYSDKAPGMALLAAPAYALGRAVAPLGADALLDLETSLDRLPRATMLIWRLMVLSSGGLLLALAGVALYRMGLRLGGNAHAALMASLSVCLATPLLGWSAQLFGHVGAGAALAGAFALATGFGHPSSLLPPLMRGLLASAALSLAVSIEYTAAPPACLIALYATWRLTYLPARQMAGVFALSLVAALAAAAPMMIYHWVSFGGPFQVGYSSVVGFEGMQEGFLGLTAPDPEVLAKILFSIRRGILWLSPLLLMVPLGIWYGLRRSAGLRPETVLCVVIASYYLLLNASYFYWAGGLSLGPRHSLPAVFFAGLPLMLVWLNTTGWMRAALWGLFGLSLFFSIASAMMTVVPSTWFPLWDPILKNLLTGQNSFFRMAEWGMSPALVFGLWLSGCGMIAWHLRRLTRSI